MKGDKDPCMRDYKLKQQGEPTLRCMAEMFAKRAAEHEQEAAIARRCLEAADARAAEKKARRDARTAERQALRNGPPAQ